MENTQTEAPVHERIDLETNRPDRMEGELDYSVFEKWATFEHREHSGSLDEIFSGITTAIEAECHLVSTGAEAASVAETEALDAAMMRLEGRFSR